MAYNVDITPETEQEIKKAEQMLIAARDYTIDSPEIMTAASQELIRIKGKAKDLESRRMAMTRPIDAAKKSVMDFFRQPLQYLADAEKLIKRAMVSYQSEQERIRRQEEAKLRERQRKEQERLRRRAEAAAKKGKEEKAEVLRTQAETMPTPIIAQSAPAPQGISTRTAWSAEVVDKMALIRAVAAGQIPDVVLAPDMKVLNAQARALKSAMSYPGVKAVSEQVLAARSA